MQFNAIKTSTVSIGTGAMTTGVAALRAHPLGKIPVGTKVTLRIDDEATNDWELSECTITAANTSTGVATFTRDTVEDGSNFPDKTDFKAGTKTVFCTQGAADKNGVNFTDIATVTPTGAHSLLLVDPVTKLAYTALVSALQPLFGSTTPADTNAPTVPTNLASSAVNQTSYTVTFTPGTDGVGVLRSEWSLDGSAWNPVAGGAAGNTFNVAGRTAGSTDTVRIRTVDTSNNPSTVATLGVTLQASADGQSPTWLAGSLTTLNVTSSGYTMSWPGAIDNVGVASIESSNDGGATWTPHANNVTTRVITGRPPLTTDQLRVRAKDAAGNISNVLSATVQTNAAATQMADLYVVRTHPNPGDTTTYYYAGINYLTGTISASGNGYFANNANVRVATPDKSTAAPTADVVAITWHTSKDSPPILANQSKTGQAVGLRPVGGQWGNGDTGNPYYGVFEPTDTLYVWGPPGNYYLWIFFADGSASLYKDGGPEAIALVLTASA